jgi:hypothetical protein
MSTIHHDHFLLLSTVTDKNIHPLIFSLRTQERERETERERDRERERK